MSSGPACNEKSDIALRLVRVLTRKRKPGPSCGRKKQDGDVVVGVVPIHLRHLYNFIDELIAEVDVVIDEVATQDEKEQLVLPISACCAIFWEALREYLDLDKVVEQLMILDTWDVVLDAEVEKSDDRTFYIEGNVRCRH